MDYVVTVVYPVEHLAAISNAAGCIDTPLTRHWLATRQSVFFEERNPWPRIDERWLQNLGQHGLINAAVDAVFDEHRCVGAYFSFHALPCLHPQILTTTFAELTPLLHQTLTGAIAAVHENSGETVRRLSALTEREREVALWVGKGKSNAEVALLTQLSENTVKHHISRILDKTGCANRAGIAALVSGLSQVPLGECTNRLLKYRR